jgi:hypothetical protein
LNPEEKAWLTQFTDEYSGNTHFNKPKKSILHKKKSQQKKVYEQTNSSNRDVYSIQQSGNALMFIDGFESEEDSENTLSRNMKSPEDALIELIDSRNETTTQTPRPVKKKK